MEINAQTKLTDILDKYPWLPDELAKLDGRFKIIKTPVGKMMIKNAPCKATALRRPSPRLAKNILANLCPLFI